MVARLQTCTSLSLHNMHFFVKFILSVMPFEWRFMTVIKCNSTIIIKCCSTVLDNRISGKCLAVLYLQPLHFHERRRSDVITWWLVSFYGFYLSSISRNDSRRSAIWFTFKIISTIPEEGNQKTCKWDSWISGLYWRNLQRFGFGILEYSSNYQCRRHITWVVSTKARERLLISR